METHVHIFATLSMSVLLLAMLTAWARRETLVRWGAILASLVILVGSYPTLVFVLSRPRDVTEEWYHRHAESALVTGIYIDEGTALYLYLVLPAMDEPRSYSFPWNDRTRQLAESLQEQIASPEAEGGVIIDRPFEPSLNTQDPLIVHPAPPEAMPEKKPTKPPLQFRSRSE